MGEVVKLKTERDEVIATVIALLEEILAEARAGTVVAVAMGIVHSDGTISAARSRTEEASRLLGALDLAHYQMLRAWEEN